MIAEATTTNGIGSIVQGMSWDEYRQWPHLSGSTLKLIELSPSHCLAALEGRLEFTDTQDKKFGTDTHCAMLEPERFEREYLLATPCCAIIQSGDNAGQACGKRSSLRDQDGNWFCGMHKGKGREEPDTYITDEAAERIRSIVKCVQSHEVVNLFRHRGGFEASLTTDLEGVSVKARMDKIRIAQTDAVISFIADIKKVQVGRGGQAEFFNSVKSYGYDFKAAFYLDIARRVTGLRFIDKCRLPAFYWVVIEDRPPHEIAVYQLTPELEEIGRTRYRRALAKFKECQESGKWPGYSDKIELLEVPDYYLRQHGILDK